MVDAALPVCGLTRDDTFLHITDCHAYASSGDKFQAFAKRAGSDVMMSVNRSVGE